MQSHACGYRRCRERSSKLFTLQSHGRSLTIIPYVCHVLTSDLKSIRLHTLQNLLFFEYGLLINRYGATCKTQQELNIKVQPHVHVAESMQLLNPLQG